MKRRERLLSGGTINPSGVKGSGEIVSLVDQHFNAFNAARLRECCRLMTEKVLRKRVVVGMSISGALSPAGLGPSCIVPLIRNGWVDWIVSTGANIYHDIHFALGLSLHRGTPFADDVELYDEGIVRIYDVLMDFKVLASTDNWLLKTLSRDEFQKRMGSSELHFRLGKCVAMEEERLGMRGRSFLAEAYRCEMPIYSSAPGDSAIGMNMSALNFVGKNVLIDPSMDVNETAAIVYEAKTRVGESAALIWGGGSPKNFVLQTEPQLQEIYGLRVKGHDYFIQVTDARPDTGGLSGATPREAVSWSKIDPGKLSNTVVCYCDSTIAMPILVSYLEARAKKRDLRRLFAQRSKLLKNLKEAFRADQHRGRAKRNPSKTVKSLRLVLKEK